MPSGRDSSAVVPDGSATQAVHARLRRLILGGGIEPGSTLSQVQLAGHLGVSRTPLREALRMLQSEGLIEAETNRMVRVAGFSVEDLEQLYALRIVNEALAIRLTVPLMTADDDVFLDRSLKDMSRCVDDADLETWEEHHRAFHERFVLRAGARPRRLLKELSDHSERYRRIYVEQEPRAWSIGAAEHEAVVAACHARDVGGAADALARHLSRTALTVLMHVVPEHEPAIVRSALRSVTGGPTVLVTTEGL